MDHRFTAMNNVYSGKAPANGFPSGPGRNLDIHWGS